MNPPDKPRLTAEQKKQNHIESERKRREAIRNGFQKLSDKVPNCKGQARSEGIVLANTVKYINDLQARKEDLRKEAQKKGMGDLEFEGHYDDVARRVRESKPAPREPKKGRGGNNVGLPPSSPPSRRGSAAGKGPSTPSTPRSMSRGTDP